MAEMVKSDWLPGGTSDTLQTEFPQSVQNMFSNPPKAAMEIEGDFVGATITGNTKAKVGTDAKVFSFPPVGSGEAPVVTGGDVAVMFNDNPAAAAFLKFMASPKAGEVWAKPGGYISPNKDVPGERVPRQDDADRSPTRSSARTTCASTCPTSTRRRSVRRTVRASGSCSRTSCRTRAMSTGSPSSSKRRRPRRMSSQ